MGCVPVWRYAGGVLVAEACGRRSAAGVVLLLLAVLQWMEPEVSGGGVTFPSTKNKLDFALELEDLEIPSSVLAVSETGRVDADGIRLDSSCSGACGGKLRSASRWTSSAATSLEVQIPGVHLRWRARCQLFRPKGRRSPLGCWRLMASARSYSTSTLGGPSDPP